MTPKKYFDNTDGLLAMAQERLDALCARNARSVTSMQDIARTVETLEYAVRIGEYMRGQAAGDTEKASFTEFLKKLAAMKQAIEQEARKNWGK